MAIYIIPEIGAKGKFLFKAPFSNNTTAATEFECMSVRTLTDIVNSGEDGYLKYYKPYGLTNDDYKSDLSQGVSLVGLLSGEGRWLYVPNNRITALPDSSGVRYQMIVLSANLGAIAETMDLSSMENAVKDVIYSYTGVVPEMQKVAVSQPAMVSEEDHERIMVARQNNVSSNPPVVKLLETLQASYSSLLSKYENLSKYVAKLKKDKII